MKLKVNINGTNRELDVKPNEMLLEVLRRYGYKSVKKGCDTGSCGVCTVLLDGEPIASCSYLALKAEGHSVTTIEGVKEEADKIGGFLSKEGAVQCGFCTPGFILTVIAMKNCLKNPSEDEINHYLVGNLCRCSGYVSHLRAIKKYLEVS